MLYWTGVYQRIVGHSFLSYFALYGGANCRFAIEFMTTKKTNPITGIRLEGFQVFGEPTHIPLERLTMLFGPNSAGKSSVQDAIELYPALMSVQNGSAAHELLLRHWRRTENDQRVDKLSIAVTHTTHDLSLHQIIEGETGRAMKTEVSSDGAGGGHWAVENRWQFEKRESDEEDLDYDTYSECFIEKDLLVRYGGADLQVNLNHPLLCQTEMEVDFFEMASTHPDMVTFSEGHLTIKGSFFRFVLSGAGWGKNPESWMGYHNGLGYKHPALDESSLFAKGIRELNVLLGCILSVANGNTSFHPTHVAASRKVPTRRDMRFQLGYLEDPMLQLVLSESPTYESLAVSLASELPNSQTNYPSPAKRRKFADLVNHALTNHLFIEQGYRLDYDFRLLMSETNSKYGLIHGRELESSEFGYLVELILRDSKGRRHLFEDVGSGIGYLLPVLCAVYEGAVRHESTCFIQQPELHIHPALQAAMGDVFIEGSDENNQLIIETHSEHLLLRVLKRVRQTHLQVHIAPELKIAADDVCVLYFDPSPCGTTTVKRLRVTEDGEFMDRWPRGFFGERDLELFDE